MFGSGQNLLNLSFFAILPAALILWYVYKRDKLPEPPRVVFITLLLGIGLLETPHMKEQESLFQHSQVKLLPPWSLSIMMEDKQIQVFN